MSAEIKAKKRVLVIDDQPLVCEALKMFLEFDGYEVCATLDCHEALALFQPGKFAIIFTDFEMPKMNGHELASIIKARDPRQPVIMVTAYSDMLTNMESVPNVDLVLGKPWSADEIRGAIRKVLDSQSG